MDDVLDRKNDLQLLTTLLPEIAKATSELRCAKNDVAKATNRLNFALVLVNKMIERNKD